MIITFSDLQIARMTLRNAFCALTASLGQMPFLQGHPMRQAECSSHSAGARKPSLFGVDILLARTETWLQPRPSRDCLITAVMKCPPPPPPPPPSIHAQRQVVQYTHPHFCDDNKKLKTPNHQNMYIWTIESCTQQAHKLNTHAAVSRVLAISFNWEAKFYRGKETQDIGEHISTVAGV